MRDWEFQKVYQRYSKTAALMQKHHLVVKDCTVKKVSHSPKAEFYELLSNPTSESGCGFLFNTQDWY